MAEGGPPSPGACSFAHWLELPGVAERLSDKKNRKKKEKEKTLIDLGDLECRMLNADSFPVQLKTEGSANLETRNRCC